MTHDWKEVEKIDVVPRILEVVCRTTGLGFAAVARVTDTQWIACAVRDEIAFGLVPGGELVLGTTICNEIRQHGRLVVIDDAATDDVFNGHPTPGLYGFRSYISVPIILHDGQFFGTLCAIDPAPARLNTVETVNMFRLFAELIAFHLDARDRMSELESRVAERTAALRSLTGKLEQTRENERTRIARELHDDLGQSLTALKLDIGVVTRTLDDQQPGAWQTSARVSLTSMATVVNTTFDSLERIVTELRPAVLDTLGICAAAEWLVDDFRRKTGTTATCRCGDINASEATATILFRVLQEALTNVVRHAAASSVAVTLRHDDDGVVMTVVDDGCGIPAQALTDSGSYGLRGMFERLHAVQGSLAITRVPSGGTMLLARCPASAPVASR